MKYFNKIKIIFSMIAFVGISFATYIFFQYQNLSVYDENLKPYYIKKQKGCLGVLVWNSYCGSCVYALKEYEYLKQYFEYNNAQFILLLISDNLTIRNAAKAHFIRQDLREMSSYFDKDSKLCSLYGINFTPTLLLFKNGKLVQKIEGSRAWKQGQDMAVINEFLGI